MKRTFAAYCLTGFSAVLWSLYPQAQAQTRSLEKSGDTVFINVADEARPLSAALQLIVSEYPFAMTYEDPPYRYEQDLEDITVVIRPDLPADHAQRIIVPRFQSLSVSAPLAADVDDREAWLGVIEEVVAAQNRSPLGGRFRVEESPDGVVHVMPVAYRNEAGEYVENTPLLDTPITIPRQWVNGPQMLEKFSEVVSIATVGYYNSDPLSLADRHLMPFRMPVNLVMSYEGSYFEANNEPARDVIIRMLHRLSARARSRVLESDSAWQVFVLFDPILDSYLMSARVVVTSIERSPAISEPALPPPDPDLSAPDFLTPEGRERLRRPAEGVESDGT